MQSYSILFILCLSIDTHIRFCDSLSYSSVMFNYIDVLQKQKSNKNPAPQTYRYRVNLKMWYPGRAMSHRWHTGLPYLHVAYSPASAIQLAIHFYEGLSHWWYQMSVLDGRAGKFAVSLLSSWLAAHSAVQTLGASLPVPSEACNFLSPVSSFEIRNYKGG